MDGECFRAKHLQQALLQGWAAPGDHFASLIEDASGGVNFRIDRPLRLHFGQVDRGRADCVFPLQRGRDDLGIRERTFDILLVGGRDIRVLSLSAQDGFSHFTPALVQNHEGVDPNYEDRENHNPGAQIQVLPPDSLSRRRAPLRLHHRVESHH